MIRASYNAGPDGPQATDAPLWAECPTCGDTFDAIERDVCDDCTADLYPADILPLF